MVSFAQVVPKRTAVMLSKPICLVKKKSACQGKNLTFFLILDRMGEKVSYEEDISTEQNKEEAFPRIQDPHVQQDRESDSEEEER